MNNQYMLEELEAVIAPSSVGEAVSGSICFSVEVSVDIVVWYYN